MANKKLTLYRKCKTPEGWKRYPACMSANGKVKPDVVLVGGVEVAYPTGHYELRSFEGSKTKWTRVEGNATHALDAFKNAQKIATAVAIAGDAGVKVVKDPMRIPLRDSYRVFVQAALDRKSTEAAEIYQRTLEEFLSTWKKTYADELTHEDVIKFHGEMRKRGLSDRTVYNRHMNLRAFIIYLGLDVKAVAGKSPKFEKTMPEIYETKELKAFFKALATDYDRLFFDLLLKTGLREREAMHLEWIDLSFERRTLQVRSKPRYNHKIKDSEEREMPLTAELVKELREYQEKNLSHRLVFGKRGGEVDEPDGHLLRRLKALAKKAGLNCGNCDGCVSSKECEVWFLHKFRANYITTLLRNGLDLRTVMALSGHADIASVMRYLRPAGTEVMQAKVDSIKWR
ncbi:tyrosine-type recombinase/integrase [Tunturiibacter gelidoferens]|uniref:Integrase n=1 Tax=Tunturiibacter gelidiferens TaxID=3069689 RepID=A0A9X0U651_9BACT|nr:site-specific integrase [Edaphobacter lichenicola]MBB5329452.1 integrase [Edaphobacter lichenicola]